MAAMKLSGAELKLGADWWPSNKKATVFQFKTGDFVKKFFKSQYFRHKGGFAWCISFRRKKKSIIHMAVRVY